MAADDTPYRGGISLKNNNIAIDGRGAIFYRGTGIGTYTHQLLRNLQKEIPRLKICLPGEEYKDLSFLSEDHNETADIWREEYLPKMLRKQQIDLYHVPQNGIGLPCRKFCKESVTIHDLIPYIFPETVGRGYLKEFLKEMPRIMERADAVITVSECSANDIRKIFDYPKEKIHIIKEAPEPIYRPIPQKTVKAYLSKNYGIIDDYILYVGGFGIRKNVRSLITAFYLLKKEENIPLKLVLPGKRNRDADALDLLIDALKLQDEVIFPDHIPVKDLPYFYNGAKMMVYPSIYEGFGLPPLEAMACGTPVIAAKTSSLPEILGDGAAWFQPFDTTELAKQIHRMENSESLRRRYAHLGKSMVEKYSWEKTAKETAAIFSKI